MKPKIMTKPYGKIYQNKTNVSITPFDIYNLYPVGSIYISVNSTNPTNYFGGTWEQIKDRFLLACGDTYTLGATGGEEKHTLSTEELPDMVTVRANVSSNAYGNQNWAGPLSGWGNYQNNRRGVTVNKAHNNMPPYLAVYIWKRIG